MESVTINNITIPLHWDDRYYLADCPKCGAEVFGKTKEDVVLMINVCG